MALKSHADLETPRARFEAWRQAMNPAIDRCRAAFADLESAGALDAAMLSVALRQLRDLA